MTGLSNLPAFVENPNNIFIPEDDTKDNEEDKETEDEGEDIDDNAGDSSTQENDDKDDKDKSSSVKGDSSTQKKNKDVPFHEHPRFKQLISKNRLLEKENQEFKTELNTILKTLKENGLVNDAEGQLDLSKMTKEQFVELVRSSMGNKTTDNKEDEVEAYMLEIEDKLLDLEEKGETFDRDTLLKIASEITDGDLDKALKHYKLVEQQVTTAVEKTRKQVMRKKAGESLSFSGGGNKSTSKEVSTSQGYISGSGFESVRQEAFKRFGV